MWFTENALPPMLIAGIAALVFFGLWNGDRRNLYFLLGIACAAAMGVFYVVERQIVTEGERIQLDVVELCDEFRMKDARALDHFSNQAPELKQLCKSAMETCQIGDDLRLTDFQTTLTNEGSRADVHFRANATISAMGFSGHHPFRCILAYQKEGGAWKIVEVQRLDPIKGDKIEVMAHR
jgi:hypothetical protein